MTSTLSEEIELSKKHEEILAKRAALLEQMESQYEQLKNKKEQHETLSRAAEERHATLLQDLQKMEQRLSVRPLLHPDIVSLETRYWAFVKEKVPEWEHLLLGKGLQPGRRRHKGTPHNNYRASVAGLPPLASLKYVR